LPDFEIRENVFRGTKNVRTVKDNTIHSLRVSLISIAITL